MVKVCGNMLQAAEMVEHGVRTHLGFKDGAVPPCVISLSAAMGPSSTTNTGSHQMNQVEGATSLENRQDPQLTISSKKHCVMSKLHRPRLGQRRCASDLLRPEMRPLRKAPTRDPSAVPRTVTIHQLSTSNRARRGDSIWLNTSEQSEAVHIVPVYG
jgi:hypothetical protein